MKKKKLILKLLSILTFLLCCWHSTARGLYLVIPQIQEFFELSDGLKNFADNFLDVNEYSVGLIFIAFIIMLINCIGASLLFKSDNKTRMSVWLVLILWAAIGVSSTVLVVYLTPIIFFFALAMFRLSFAAKHMFDVALADYTAESTDKISNSKSHINAYNAEMMIYFPYVKHLVVAFMYAAFCMVQLAYHWSVLYAFYKVQIVGAYDMVYNYLMQINEFSAQKTSFFLLASLIVAVSLAVVYKSKLQYLISISLVAYTAFECFVLAGRLFDGLYITYYLIATLVILALACNFFTLINCILAKNKIKVSSKVIFYKLRCFTQLICSVAYMIIVAYFIINCIINALSIYFTFENVVLEIFVYIGYNRLVRIMTVALAVSLMVIYKSVSVSLTSWSLYTMMIVQMFCYGDGIIMTIVYIIFALCSLFMLLSVLKYVQLSLEQYARSIQKVVTDA